MMKRMLPLLAAVCLLFGIPALAEESLYTMIENAMYHIVLRTEEGDLSLGSGVLFSDKQVLLTSAACAAEGTLYAIGTDGEHAVKSAQAIDRSGIALLELAQPAHAAPLQLASEDAAGLACLFGINSAGEFIVAPLHHVLNHVYQNQSAMLLTSSEGLLPGSFLTDENGHLIGLSIAQQAEGLGSYIALDANGLYRALTRQQYLDSFLPAEAVWEDGQLTLSWTDKTRDSGFYLITISGDDNQYYTFFQTAYDERAIQLILPPEHRYEFQVQWTDSADNAIDPVWAAMNEIIIPGAAFTSHSYTQQCSLVTRTDDKSQILPIDQVTEDVLNDPALRKFLHVKANYQVDDPLELPMTIELHTPDGQFFFESAHCILSPEKKKTDSFLLPLDDLLSDCKEFCGNMLQPGEYHIRYAISGGTAGEYTFTLAEDVIETPVPVTSSTGYISELTGKYKNGMLTLTWPAEAVPDGASLYAFNLYEGNFFFSYYKIPKGTNRAEIYTVPDRDTFAWIAWTMEDTIPELAPEDENCLFVQPAAEVSALTDYNFRNIRLGIVPSSDPDAEKNGVYLPEVSLTREILSNREVPIYFQTEDTYQIDATDDADHPLALVFYTPDNLCFLDPSLYIYDVTLQESDLWLKDISYIFDDYEYLMCINAWPAGEYRLVYYIDGKTAGEIVFTLD